MIEISICIHDCQGRESFATETHEQFRSAANLCELNFLQSLLHARDKCTVSLLLDKHIFLNGEIEPTTSLVIGEREKFLGLILVSFWKTCSLLGEPKEGQSHDV